MDRQAFIDAIVATAERVEGGSAAGTVPADPGDEMVVAAAVAGEATYIVALDRHLLSLEGPPGVRVLRPGDFLGELRSGH